MELLSRDYDVQTVCKLMNVSRAGYYKWKKRDKSKRDLNREEMIELVKTVHADHSTHGYRWTAAFIRINHSQCISDNYAYKCYKYLGIKADTKHQAHCKPRKVKDKYPNLIFSTWDTVDRPRQVVVSDMVTFKFGIYYYEVTFYFDVFTKEMLTCKLAERRGSRMQYIDGLEDVKGLLRGSTGPTILHTDQGSVYASMAYNELIKDTNIVRSMSRAGKPTDNPVNESLNGWIKEELMMDFRLEECRHIEDVEAVFKKYQKYYNEQRPCFAIGYDTPTNYRRRYNNGELPHKNSFEGRVLTEIPKFVQKKKLNAINQENDKGVSTIEKENLKKNTQMTTFANE